MKPIKTHLAAFLVIIACLTFFSACGGATSQITGKWAKAPLPTPTPGGSALGGIFSAFGDAMYPQTIEFFRDGTYAGSVGTLLSGGAYEVIEQNRIKMATLQGLSVYEFAIEGDTLIIKEQQGMQVRYQRAK